VYRKLEESSVNVLGYEARGRLPEKELGVIPAYMEEAIHRFGKITCSSTFRGYPGWALAPSGDLEFVCKHTKDIERHDVVGGSALLDWIARLEGPLLGIRIKLFEPDRLEEAWRWLYEREAD
jgi:hypothetical protein